MSNDRILYKKAIAGIKDLFNDMSVSKEEAIDALDLLVEEIEMMKESLIEIQDELS